MKNNFNYQPPTEGNGWTEGDFLPFDRYGNYVGEMSFLMETETHHDQKEKSSAKEVITDAGEFSNPSLGIA